MDPNMIKQMLMQQAPPPQDASLGQPMTPQPQGQTLPKSQEDIIIQALIKQLERIDKRMQMGVPPEQPTGGV